MQKGKFTHLTKLFCIMQPNAFSNLNLAEANPRQ
jgi:hypothetical protein